mgnify:FL=1|tara:strand:- start:194 stop:631 length:438 start_codon:yes stop_codon:yes gene_type:complete
MYHLCKHDRFFIVRWEETTLRALREIEGELVRYQRSVGHPLVYISLADDRTRNPDAEVQRALVDFVDRHRDALAHVYVVLESKGFAAAAQRAVLSSMMMISGRRGVVTVKSSMAEAVSEALPGLGTSWPQVSAAMERDGVHSAKP